MKGSGDRAHVCGSERVEGLFGSRHGKVVGLCVLSLCRKQTIACINAGGVHGRVGTLQEASTAAR